MEAFFLMYDAQEQRLSPASLCHSTFRIMPHAYHKPVHFPVRCKQILDLAFLDLDLRYCGLDLRSWILDLRTWILDMGSRTLDLGS